MLNFQNKEAKGKDLRLKLIYKWWILNMKSEQVSNYQLFINLSSISEPKILIFVDKT